MKIEKKLIACSILALLIGISSVVPLLFLMSESAKAETVPKPQFHVEVPYAYIQASFSNAPSVTYSIVLNFTLISDAKTAPCDAQIEYYLLDVYSDKGYIGNLTEYIGTCYNNTFKLPIPFFNPDYWFTAGGQFYYNWTTGESYLSKQAGGGTNWVPTFGEPETIFISIRRLGWITFNGNSTVTTWANGEEIAKIQLEKYGNGFLHNNLIPEDQLSQIDLLNPPFGEIAEPGP